MGAAAQIRPVYKGHKVFVTLKLVTLKGITLSLSFQTRNTYKYKYIIKIQSVSKYLRLFEQVDNLHF